MRSLTLKNLTLGSIITATLLLSGCGGGGGSSSSNLAPEVKAEETPVPVTKNKGFYVDSAVKGVEFVCGDTTGVTDDNGTFTFDDNNSCTFKLGDVTLREINASALENSVIILEDNVTIARFLQSLDIDGNPDNGIEIDNSVRSTLAEQNLTSVAESDDDVADIVIALEGTDSYQGQMVTKTDAKAHIDRSKERLKGENSVTTTSSLSNSNFLGSAHIESGSSLETENSTSGEGSANIDSNLPITANTQVGMSSHGSVDNSEGNMVGNGSVDTDTSGKGVANMSDNRPTIGNSHVDMSSNGSADNGSSVDTNISGKNSTSSIQNVSGFMSTEGSNSSSSESNMTDSNNHTETNTNMTNSNNQSETNTNMTDSNNHTETNTNMTNSNNHTETNTNMTNSNSQSETTSEDSSGGMAGRSSFGR